MRRLVQRIALSIVGGTLFQLLVLFLCTLFGVSGLSLIFVWAAVLFVGDQYPQPWGPYLAKWVLVIAIDNLLYSTFIYFLLWNPAKDRAQTNRAVDF
jgi:hypothetical protein